jgi:tetratricopeptide (TPR) repeat protein
MRTVARDRDFAARLWTGPFRVMIPAVVFFCLPVTLYGEDAFKKHCLHAREFFREQEYEKSLQAMERAREINPRHFGVWLGLGEIYRRQGEYARAIDCYNKFLEFLPRKYRKKAFEGLYRRALAYKFSLQFDLAVQELRALVKMNPKDPQFRFHLGHCLFLQEEYDRALPEFIKASQIDPKIPYYRLWIALILCRTDSPGDAVEELKRFQDDYGSRNWPEPIFLLFRGALRPDELERLVADKPLPDSFREQCCEAMFFLGMWYLEQGDVERAEKYFSRCVQTGVIRFNEHLTSRVLLDRIVHVRILGGP